MEIKDSYELPLPKERVWAALNDEEFLKKSIPWCEKLERRSETELAAEVKLKIGPMSTRFTGSITLSDIDPPNGYTITGSGKGGIAGAASGSAKVKLVESKDTAWTTYPKIVFKKPTIKNFFGSFVQQLEDINKSK